MNKIFFVLIIGICFCSDLKAFSFMLQNFDVDHGLPSSETHKVFQDSKGYIWVATDAGVSRYDGYRFNNFTTHEGLSDNTVFGFYEDRQGRIWFRTFSGDLSYYYEGIIYRPFENAGFEKVLNGDIMVSLYVDEHDTLWASGQRFLYKIYLPGKKIQRVPVSSHYYIKTFSDGKYIFGRYNDGNIATFDLMSPSGNLTIPAHPTMHRSLANVWLSVTTKAKGDFIFSDGSAIYRIRNKQIEQLHLPVGENGFIFTYTDKNYLWVGKIKGGVTRVDLNTMDTLHLLPHMTVTSMIIDRAGAYWFSTTEKGIYYLNNFWVRSLKINNDTYNVQGLAVSPAGLFIGSSQGLFNYSFVDHSISFIDQNYIRNVHYKDNQVYYSASSYIRVIDSYTHRFKQKYKINNVINFSSAEEKIFYHNHRDVGTIDAGSIPVSLPSRPHCIYVIHKDSLLVGTQYGVYVIGKDHKAKRVFTTEKMLNCRIEDIKVADDGTIYFATRGNGLIIRKDKKFYKIDKEHGLKSDICYKIWIATNKNIYIGTNNGISVFKQGELNPFFFISKAQGLISGDVQSLVEWDSQIYAGTSKGVSVFPVSFVPASAPPPFFIESVQTSDSIFHHAGSITLKPSDNFFSIRFVALRYDDSGERMYRYRISELDNTWKETANTFVNYSKLPKGNYTFEVQAVNALGQASSETNKVSVVLLPYFYQTGWFILLCAALVIILVGGGIYIFLKRKLEKSRNRIRFAELELKALRSQINPHFIFNCLASVQNLILKNEVDGAELYLGKFSSFLRNNLNASRENFIPLQKELRDLQQYVELESMRLKNNFFYFFHIDPKLESSKLYVPPMLIQPYIENAIWHGLHHKNGEKNLIIKALSEKDGVRIIIHDNGIGREASAAYNNETRKFKSLGMQITNERLEMLRLQTGFLFSVTIFDEYTENNIPSGTRVELTLPYIENEFINRYYRRRGTVHRDTETPVE